ncbi:hypothetical protein ASPFODRAFT_57191 [Aspergillus luchuensis CBS 106.47]|uniref:F-box domain-containing protein n=1 Tax=Aspergillus luchuensis (strain CBS 106.47) TaxID=1137211 RepID=A0A1M3TW61_ASPLC|nr:hypothetical protein ASPFODRAFT_57191 [Aspergillus luchuensis CBS 106.47]
MLDKLPTEILNMTLSYVTSHKDLKQVCEVCTRLRDCAIPCLYQCLVFNDPEATYRESAAAVKSIPRRYASHIRDIELRVPIHYRNCYHEMDDDYVWLDEDDAFDTEDSLFDYFEYMEDELEREIEDGIEVKNADDRFLDDQLRTFRWNMGMCIPNMILSSNGFSLLRKQKKIRSLILYTDAYCHESVGSVDLAQFQDLRSLCWKGLNKYSDFECLKDCIRAHGHQLLSLTLDLVNWDHAKNRWTHEFCRQSDEGMPNNFFVQRIMNAKVGNERIVMQSLEYLDLSAISFEHADAEVPFLFNAENLRSLKLRKCLGSLNLLELASSSGKWTELKYFELVLTNSGPTTTTKIICNFIHSAPKLETLCLMLREPINRETLISTIRRCSCLKRLVMHSLADERNPVLGGEEHKVNQLQGLQARPSCKLLHIRATGTAMIDPLYHPLDIYEFAEWAFSAEGLPDLTHNSLFCRSKTGYRRLDESEISLWDLVNDNMDMLAACPYTDTNVLSRTDFL